MDTCRAHGRPSVITSAGVVVDDEFGRWPSRRARDGGVDKIPTPDGCGNLWLCGKHVVAPDPEAALSRIEPLATVVCLNERSDFASRYPHYADWLIANQGERALWFSMPDWHAPPLDEALVLLDDIAERIRSGGHILMHCSAGMGRAGTMGVSTLMMLGVELEAALDLVASYRPGAGPGGGSQTDLVIALADRIGGGAM